MKLSDRQKVFTFMIGELIRFAYDNGYCLTFGDAKRDRNAIYPYKVHPNSLHYDRLAVDFNLFKNGRYLKDTEDYLELGLFWESLGGAWGGRFRDANHFSLEYKGMK